MTDTATMDREATVNASGGGFDDTIFEQPHASCAITNEDFLKAIFGEQYEWCHVTGFREDPNDPHPGGTKEQRAAASKRVWAGGFYFACNRMLRETWNTYYVVSRFRPVKDAETGRERGRRRAALFHRMHIITVDDVGVVGVGTAKVQRALVLERMGAPSYRLETSPGNEQWGYILAEPEADRRRADALVNGMIARGLASDSKDPGMKGVTRYVRLPTGSNRKAKYITDAAPDGFPCRLRAWNPERRFAVESLAAAWGIDLSAETATGYSRDRERAKMRVEEAHDPWLRALSHMGHVHTSVQGDPGMYEITCPNIDEHTDGVDSGTKRMPNGMIWCHHGHCADLNREGQQHRYHALIRERMCAQGDEDLLDRFIAEATAQEFRALFRDGAREIGERIVGGAEIGAHEVRLLAEGIHLFGLKEMADAIGDADPAEAHAARIVAVLSRAAEEAETIAAQDAAGQAQSDRAQPQSTRDEAGAEGPSAGDWGDATPRDDAHRAGGGDEAGQEGPGASPDGAGAASGAQGGEEPKHGSSDAQGGAEGKQGLREPTRVYRADYGAPPVPVRRTVVGPLARGQVTAVAGPPAMSKSSWALLCAAAIAWERPDLIGAENVERPGAVLVISNEDDVFEVERRLQAVARSHGLDWRALRHDIRVEARNSPVILLEPDADNHRALDETADVKKIIEAGKKHGLALLVVDTLASVVRGGDENNAGHAHAAVAVLNRMAREADMAVLVLHHTTKAAWAGTGAGDLSALRGSGALAGAVRAALTMTGLGKADGGRLGMDEEETFRWSRLDGAKFSYSGRTGKPMWFRRVAVTLRAADERKPDEQAEVTAVALRHVPEGPQPAPVNHDAMLDHIACGVAGLAEPYSRDKRAKDGRYVVPSLMLDFSITEERAEAWLDEMLAVGRLRVEKRKVGGGGGRHERLCLIAVGRRGVGGEPAETPVAGAAKEAEG